MSMKIYLVQVERMETRWVRVKAPTKEDALVIAEKGEGEVQAIETGLWRCLHIRQDKSDAP